ncbi:MAG: hypothetical protein H0V87_12210 [Chloroflexi bacterium]|nr:hypothetical protein [Chloroflexota bacterium]
MKQSEPTRRRDALRPADLLPLAVGVAALAGGTAFGWDARLVDAIVTPPAVVRAVLVGLAVVGGAWLLAAGLRRIGAETAERSTAPDLPTMVRGVRLVFLGVALFAASVGWVVAHPLPLVIALIIAGVDVVETSFLLLVVRARRTA